MNLLKIISARSIRFFIIVPYVIVTFVLGMIVLYITTQLMATTSEGRFQNQLKDATTIITKQAYNQEQLRLDVARYVANTIGIPEAAANEDWQKVFDLVSPIMSTNTQIDHILILDTYGQEVRRLFREVNNPNGAKFQSVIDSRVNLANWLSVAKVLGDTSGQSKSVEIATDEYSHQVMVYTVVPLLFEQRVVGVALIGNAMQKQLRLFKAVGAADVILFNRLGGVMLASLPVNDEDNANLSRILTRARYQEILAKRETETLLDSVKIGQQSYRLAYTPFILQGQIYGMLGVVLSDNFIISNDVYNRNFLVLAFTLVALTILALGYGIARFISGPILSLVDVTRAIAQGDLNQRTGEVHGYEVGKLATNFDTMTIELKRKNEELEQQAGQLRAILSSMADGVLVQDTNGNILTKNRAIDKILDKVQKEDALEYGSNKDALTTLLDSLENFDYHDRHNLEIGPHTLNAVATPVTTSDKAHLGSVVVLRDITREVESEKLKDKFISGTSHELKTPLTAMKGYQAILRILLNQSAKFLASDINDRLVDTLSKSEKQIDYLDNMVQSMLDVSQIEGHEFNINSESLNLSELIEIVTTEWYDKMVHKGLVFRVALPEEVLWLQGDYERLTQVLQHLIKNSYDYTLVGEVVVTVQRHDQQVVITIADTGVGVLEEDQRYLFTRFFRAIHEESTYSVAGAGLGLYISKAIIELHQGEISMVSQPYQGSTVTLTLPLIPTPDESDWS